MFGSYLQSLGVNCLRSHFLSSCLKGYPLQYSGLENPLDSMSWTRLSDVYILFEMQVIFQKETLKLLYKWSSEKMATVFPCSTPQTQVV